MSEEKADGFLWSISVVDAVIEVFIGGGGGSLDGHCWISR